MKIEAGGTCQEQIPLTPIFILEVIGYGCCI